MNRGMEPIGTMAWAVMAVAIINRCWKMRHEERSQEVGRATSRSPSDVIEALRGAHPQTLALVAWLQSNEPRV